MPTKPTIQDQTFLFTGTLTEFTRDEAEALVVANGGKVISGVTAKLNYLVVGEDAGSKLDKAKKLGTVKILTEKEFLKMVTKGKGTVKKPAEKKTTKSSATKKATTKVNDKPAVSIATATKVSGKTAFEEVKIGKQIWMAKNLDVTHFINGEPITQAKNAKDWENASIAQQPIFSSYESKKGNERIYGNLYNWYAVNDPRGLAPTGWLVPSDEDFKQLLDFLGEQPGEKNEELKWLGWKCYQQQREWVSGSARWWL